MLKNLLIALMACAALAFAGPAGAAGDIDAGKSMAKKCSGCHGANGEGKKDNPPLAGMNLDLHVKAMEDYRTGERKHKAMERLAKKLSDDAIVDLAAYYESLK